MNLKFGCFEAFMKHAVNHPDEIAMLLLRRSATEGISPPISRIMLKG